MGWHTSHCSLVKPGPLTTRGLSLSVQPAPRPNDSRRNPARQDVTTFTHPAGMTRARRPVDCPGRHHGTTARRAHCREAGPMTTSHEWHLIRRPHGAPVDEDFALVEVELPEPGEGQVVVRNTFLSVDPYMRGRMNDSKSYVPPFQL